MGCEKVELPEASGLRTYDIPLCLPQALTPAVLPGIEPLVGFAQLFAAGNWPVTLGYCASIHFSQSFIEGYYVLGTVLRPVGDTEVNLIRSLSLRICGIVEGEDT